MASLEHDPLSGRYRVRFRYEGRAYKRSLRTESRRVALAALGQVEETLRLREVGMSEVPSGVEPGRYILSGAPVRRARSVGPSVRTLVELFRVYEDGLPTGAKQANTLEGEAIHKRHLLRHLGGKRLINGITAAYVQRYVNRRAEDHHRGRRIGAPTIKKELSTLSLVWNWAKRHKHIETLPPTECGDRRPRTVPGSMLRPAVRPLDSLQGPGAGSPRSRAGGWCCSAAANAR